MRTIFCIVCLLLAQAARAQVVAPTPEQAGSPRGEDKGNYNVMESFETGYRFATVTGNDGTYRADVNYGNGIRLLSSNLSIFSKDGHGRWFDQIVLTTIGLGNDPYESVLLRIEKNKLYRYNMQWRQDDYFNPGLAVAAGQHLMDTSRHLQDHDLTLLPDAKIQFHLGYSRNTQDGPALSSVELTSDPGTEFPVLENIKREEDSYRLGADANLGGFKFTVLHSWVDFKEDSGFRQTDPNFQRSEPFHGTSPYWLGNLTKAGKNYAVNGRITYVNGHRNFIMDESAFGLTPVGAQNQQILVGGDASRPSVAGDLSISFSPVSNLTVVNNTSVNSIRIDGTSNYQQVDFAAQTADFVSFRYLGLRTIANATDLHYRVRKWISVYGGYHYSDRKIKDIEQYAVNAPFSGPTFEQVNLMQTGLLGVRIKPVGAMTINLESEIGRANRPFTPVSDRDYHSLNGRFEYKLKKLTFDAAYKQNYNNNSVSFSAYSSHARDYSVNASWAGRNWFTLDASYAKLHLDSLSGILYFAGVNQTNPLAANQIYISNIHAANLAARFVVAKKVDLYLGYNITKDTGDGRTANPTDVFTSVQTFPLNFQSPMARVSVQLYTKLRWNAGWQFYNYHEQFGLLSFYQGYHANTGYTSLTWAF